MLQPEFMQYAYLQFPQPAERFWHALQLLAIDAQKRPAVTITLFI